MSPVFLLLPPPPLGTALASFAFLRRGAGGAERGKPAMPAATEAEL
jgi:hypothetical protein